MPGIGTLLNLIGQLAKLPSKAMGAASKSIKGLPSKIQAMANKNVEGGLEEAFDGSGRISSLKNLFGNSSDTKTEAKNIWQTLNRGFVQPVARNLPSLKYVNAENLIKKPFKSMLREAVKEKLDSNKTKRESKKIVEHNEKQHQELKEKWKLTRQQRNSNVTFNENSRDFSQQYSSEARSLQDYYSTLLDQNIPEREKIEAEFRLEREKLETKYEQLAILQESLSSIQKNFGKMAVVNDNNFDVIQEQIASSADLSDAKQSGYNENLSSDIEYLQASNDSNAEVIVDAIAEGQELQTESLNQLNSNIIEQNQQRDQKLEEALQDIEQQQRERHIQQMYVLNNMGAELIAAEQQREAQSSEQAYVYNKFMKKQQETKLSIPNMLIGSLLGVLNMFFKALANPEQVVDTFATAVGSFAAEMLSFIQFVVGNSMYGLGHLFKSVAGPINSFLATVLPPDFARALMIDKSLLRNMVNTAQYLPRQFASLGMPDMTLMPPPEIAGIKDDDTMATGFWNLKNNFVDTIKTIPDKIKADWAAAEGLSGVAQFIGSYAAPALMIPAAIAFPPLIPVALGTIGAKALTLAGGIERTYDEKEGKFVSRVKEVKQYGDVKADNISNNQQDIKALPIPATSSPSTKAQVVTKPIEVPHIDVEQLTAPQAELKRAKSEYSKENTSEEFESSESDSDKASVHIDNSTNYYNTYVTQQEDKQIATGV